MVANIETAASERDAISPVVSETSSSSEPAVLEETPQALLEQVGAYVI